MSQVFYATVFPDQSVSVQTSLDCALDDYKEAERLSVEGGGETVALYVKEMETILASWEIEMLIIRNSFEGWTRLKRRTGLTALERAKKRAREAFPNTPIFESPALSGLSFVLVYEAHTNTVYRVFAEDRVVGYREV